MKAEEKAKEIVFKLFDEDEVSGLELQLAIKAFLKGVEFAQQQTTEQEYLNQFECSDCSNSGQDNFSYERTVANGEIWHCHQCDKELIIDEEKEEQQTTEVDTETICKIEKEAEKWLDETDTMQFGQVELCTMFATYILSKSTQTQDKVREAAEKVVVVNHISSIRSSVQLDKAIDELEKALK